jgi:hypothetical protein
VPLLACTKGVTFKAVACPALLTVIRRVKAWPTVTVAGESDIAVTVRLGGFCTVKIVEVVTALGKPAEATATAVNAAVPCALNA